jgi:hypothetical protein
MRDDVAEQRGRHHHGDPDVRELGHPDVELVVAERAEHGRRGERDDAMDDQQQLARSGSTADQPAGQGRRQA